jgi:hypothetical protein
VQAQHSAISPCHSARVKSMTSFLRVTHPDEQVLNGAYAARHHQVASFAGA